MSWLEERLFLSGPRNILLSHVYMYEILCMQRAGFPLQKRLKNSKSVCFGFDHIKSYGLIRRR